jgi:UDPglucose 6-dehydrogenase
VVTLKRLAESKGETIPVITAIQRSNELHGQWTYRQLQSRLGTLHEKTVAVLGLTYTANTDTLRRSAAIELCRKLLNAGANVTAVDPAVKSLPPNLDHVRLVNDASAALQDVDAGVICTEWPQFREANWARVIPAMRRPLIIDPNRFLENELKNIEGVEHLSVGRIA